ncbi:zf-CCHC domain-containing protein [Tanacetum coccineum]|uniref:Zf-CCHC domain-containing protein n=1 Tax=Tanacetum coccineum TaxID=301880 RepID=A0ABQ5BVW8_9ASTR
MTSVLSLIKPPRCSALGSGKSHQHFLLIWLMDRVKEEDSITDVENAVLGVVNPLCLFFIDQRVLISFIPELFGHSVELSYGHQRFSDRDYVNLVKCLDRSMDSNKYLEGQSMQRPPFFKSDNFIYWKNRFETYVKSKDLDLWHVITDGDFQPIIQNPETKLDEVVPFDKQTDDLKRRLAKNNEAKMVIYNSLQRKEYERIFMCNTAKEIWKTLLITHQGNSQVKDNKIDLLVQQYEQFVISKDELIDSVFARFNTIITNLKALDEDYFSKNYVRKVFRALHPKYRAKVMAIKESKDLTSLSLDELIENLKVHEMVIKKDSEIIKAKVERKSLALKAKSSSKRKRLIRETSSKRYKKTFQEVVLTRTGKSDRKCFRCGDPNHLIGECPKPPKDKNQRAFVGGSWSDSGEEDDEKVKNKTCLVAQASSEVCSESSYFSDENSSIDDLILDSEYDKLCKMSLKIITKNKRLKATRNSLEKELSILKEKVSTLEKNKGVDLECVKCHMLKVENEKLKEEALKLTKFEKSTHCLNEMLNNQKPSGEKLGLGFNSFEASSSGTKEIKFVKAQKKAFSDGGPINMGGPLSVQAAPKENMGPPPVVMPDLRRGYDLPHGFMEKQLEDFKMRGRVRTSYDEVWGGDVAVTYKKGQEGDKTKLGDQGCDEGKDFVSVALTSRSMTLHGSSTIVEFVIEPKFFYWNDKGFLASVVEFATIFSVDFMISSGPVSLEPPPIQSRKNIGDLHFRPLKLHSNGAAL